jgi:hypothetical protein
MVGRNQMAQCSLQYTLNNYAWVQTNHDEKRDSNDYLASLGWFYFFGKNREGFLNMRYAMDYNDAQGCNWDYLGNRFTIVTMIPLAKRTKLSVACDYLKRGYRKTNSVYHESRTDNVFTFSNMLAIEIFKNTDLEVQFTFLKNQSSIATYEYVRKVASAGVKYKF